jgi:hypothetical protein
MTKTDVLPCRATHLYLEPALSSLVADDCVAQNSVQAGSVSARAIAARTVLSALAPMTDLVVAGRLA